MSDRCKHGLIEDQCGFCLNWHEHGKTNRVVNRIMDRCDRAHSSEIQKDTKAMRDKTIKLCEECNKNPPLHPKGKLCASCMAKRSNAARRSNIKSKKPQTVTDKGKGKEAGLPPPATQKTERTPDTAVITIDFGEHAAILREVEKLSIQELRPIHLQVIYILKHYLSNIKEG